MAAWSTFYPHLLPFVQACPEPLLNQELRMAAQTFFRRSRAWVQWLQPITLTAANTYALPLPADSAVVRLEQATLDGTPVAIPNWRLLDRDPALTPAQSSGVTTADRISVQLVQSFAAGSVLSIQASLAPSDTATTLPDDQVAQHRQAILHGARSKLLLIPDKTFTNPQNAVVENDLFEDAIGTAQHQAYKGFGRQVPRMRYRSV